MKYPRITIRVTVKQREWLEKESKKKGIKLSVFIKSILFKKQLYEKKIIFLVQIFVRKNKKIWFFKCFNLPAQPFKALEKKTSNKTISKNKKGLPEMRNKIQFNY